MKKIISLLVITTMIFSMVASLNITTVSAESTNLYEFKHFTEETIVNNNTVKKGMFTEYDGTTYKGKYFQISTQDKTKDVTYYPDGVAGVTEEPVLKIISDKYIWNNKAQINLANHPVVNISFQYYIPKGTENDARLLYLRLAKENKTAKEPYNNNGYGIYVFYFIPRFQKICCTIFFFFCGQIIFVFKSLSLQTSV